MTTIQSRHDTAANWTTANPTLAAGEIGVETDTHKLKIGDGTTAWTSLAYASGQTDSELSSTSENPVQNRIVNANFDIKQDELTKGTGISIDNSTIDMSSYTFPITISSNESSNFSSFNKNTTISIRITPFDTGTLIIRPSTSGSRGIYIQYRSDYTLTIYDSDGLTNYNTQTYTRVGDSNNSYCTISIITYSADPFYSSVSLYYGSGGLYLPQFPLSFGRDNDMWRSSGTLSLLASGGDITINSISKSTDNVISVDTSVVPTLSGTNNFTGTLQYSGTEVAKADASNFTSAGTTTLSSYGMPSSRYVNLTLGDSGTTYTAPANGWYCWRVYCTTVFSTSNYIELNNSNINLVSSQKGNGANPWLETFIPIAKGQEIHYYYNFANVTYSSSFRFVYAEGNPSS